ncbi:hypothetical protein J6590_090205 [Homalodisca vitripennis]|nr:hypothetical protein J6590_090205 [Homalodisca vitripennis]
MRDYTQATRSRSYAYRKTLPLQSSPVHNETARLQLGLTFKNLYGPLKTVLHSSPLRMRALYTSQVACSGSNNPQKLQRLLRIKSKAEIKISEVITHVKKSKYHCTVSRYKVRILMSRTTKGSDVCKPGAKIMNFTDLSTLSSGSCCFFIPSSVATGSDTHYRENKGLSDRNRKPECSGDYGELLDCNQADRWEYAMCPPMRDGV